MKVYFTASINQRSEYLEEYQTILDLIEKLGHNVLTSFDVIDQKLHYVLSASELETKDFYQTWLQTISKADVSIIEMSFPSTVNIGLEMSQILERGKPVICLYKKGKNPTFVGDYHSNRIVKLEYTLEDLEVVLNFGFEEVGKLLNRRFTFFITPEIEAYLDKVSNKKSISKSEYLRNLIEKQISESSK